MHRRPRTNEARRRCRRLIGEALEPRRLLATLSGGVLEIAGTGGAESVTITRDGVDLVVNTNGASQRFATSGVTSIRASLGAGNDSIAIADDVAAPASLRGEAGDDTLRGGGGRDTINGGSGADTVLYAGRSVGVVASLTAKSERPSEFEPRILYTVGTGGAEGDVFRDVETIVGGDGNDSLSIGAQLFGGIDLPAATPTLTLVARGGAGADSFSLGADTDYGYSFVRTIADGGAGGDVFSYSGTGGGNAVLIGGAGDDRFSQGSDDSGATVDAGAGRDTLDLDNQPGINGFTIPLGLEVVNANAPNVVITGNAEANEINVEAFTGVRIDGLGGNDRIAMVGSRGSLNPDGSNITGGDGDDTLVGLDGPDTLDGGAGDDSLVGGAADDALIGGDGEDTLDGGAGDDRMDGGSGDDVIDGGAGLADVVSYATRSAPIVATLVTDFRYPEGYPDENPDARPAGFTGGTGGGDGEADRFANVETIVGGSGDDSLTLDAILNVSGGGPIAPVLTRIEGRGGDDSLTVAGAIDGPQPSTLGRQVADGGAGDDTFEFIYNASGATTLVGGDGDDTFSTSSDDSRAVIDGGAGRDLARFDANLGAGGFVMPDGLEDFTCTNLAGTVIGNGLDNVIVVAGASLVEAAGGDDDVTVTGDLGGATATLRGGTGDDTLRGAAGAERLEGGSGDDRLSGDGGNDTLFGGSGNDRLEGGAGADSLNGEANEDALFGDDGNDVLLGGSGNDAIDPGLGDDNADGGAGGDALTYESRATGRIVGSVTATLVLAGGVYSLRVRADAGDAATGERDGADNVEVLTGGGGNDTLDLLAEPGDWPPAAAGTVPPPPILANGAGGDDVIRLTGLDASGEGGLRGLLSTVPMYADGGAGDDALSATLTPEFMTTLLGGDGDDTFAYAGYAGLASVGGGAGDDVFDVTRRDVPGAGDVPVAVASALDLLMSAGLEGANVASDGRVGVRGNDAANRITVRTRGRDIRVTGGAGDDRIDVGTTAGIAEASVDGGEGEDNVLSSGLIDSLRGGAGDDTLSGGAESDKLWGGEGDDRLVGGGGKDVLRGEAGRDTLLGFSGSDKLYGGSSNDRLDGGDDQDTVEGEAGRDTVYGGNGRDTGRRDRDDRIFEGIEILL